MITYQFSPLYKRDKIMALTAFAYENLEKSYFGAGTFILIEFLQPKYH
jgi:hypothetical protein